MMNWLSESVEIQVSNQPCSEQYEKKKQYFSTIINLSIYKIYL